MTPRSPAQDDLTARLLLCLSRWSLATALSLLATTAFYLAASPMTVSGSAPGAVYADLMQAVGSLGFFRLATLSETFQWLMLGGTLIFFAVLFARRAPIRAAFVAVCGIAQLAGSLGSALRLSGVGELAALYASAPNQQAAVLQSFLDLNRVIQPFYGIATLLWGVGALLVVWVVWQWRDFPRWLAVWLALTGVLGFVLFVPRAMGSSAAILPLILVSVIALIILHIALAVTFWRPRAALLDGAAVPSGAL